MGFMYGSSMNHIFFHLSLFFSYYSMINDIPKIVFVCVRVGGLDGRIDVLKGLLWEL